MQDTPAFVAQILAQMAEPAVRLVNQDQGIRICHNIGIIETIYVPKLIHIDNPTGLLALTPSLDHSCLRNFRASARVS